MRRRSYPDKKPSQAQARAALQTLLVCAVDLSRLSVESLARSYNLPANEIIAMLEAERLRRRLRA